MYGMAVQAQEASISESLEVATLKEDRFAPIALSTSSEISLPPEITIALGLGYNSLQDTFRANAIQVSDDDIASVSMNKSGIVQSSSLRLADEATSIGQQIRYKFEFASTLYELRESLKVSAEASFGGSSFSASAKAQFFSSFDLSRTASYIVFSMEVVNAMERLENCQLTSDAAALLNSGDFARFFSVYGDEYVTTITTGGDMTIVFEVNSQSEQTKRDFDAQFSVGYGAFNASGSIEKKFSEVLQDKQINVRFLKRGGDSGIFTTDTQGDVSQVVLDIFELAEKFPEEVKRNPVQVAAGTSDYNSCLGAKRLFPTFFNTRLVIDGVVNLLEQYGQPLDDYQLCIKTALSAGCSYGGGTNNAVYDLQDRVLALYRDPFGAEQNPSGGKALISDLSRILYAANLPPAPAVPAGE